ncbi:MAG: right-handed parallel beta-helix repeat-containing protein [Roseiflexaceae bacterium]
MKQIGSIIFLWLLLIAFGFSGVRAASIAEPADGGIAAAPGAPRYDIGSPTLADLWVDPANGDDGNSGATREQALRSVTEAWNRVPSGATLNGTGYRIMLVRGSYAEAALPNYLELRRGTVQFPIILQAADGPGSAILQGDLNIANSSYIYLIDLDIAPLPPGQSVPAGDTLHCELCDHFLVRGVRLNGGVYVPGPQCDDPNNMIAHDNFKVNQSQYVYVEDSDIAGACDNAVDFVAVQYGHIVGNRIHNAQDWCMYQKGGSAYFRVEGNEFYDCGTGGFTAGQGTGFQFMTAPWLHYEAYDIKVVNNLIHDTAGAGLGVNGGYNILLAYNTLYRVGARDHVLEIVHGRRGCDGGDAARCQPLLSMGGWGLTGDEQQFIPNRNVYIYNNIIYNPAGYQSSQQFDIRGAVTPPAGSNAPNPAFADDGVDIRGNLIWNGPADLPLGIEDSSQGCQATNPTCNADQLLADNAINTVEPQLANPRCGDFHPLAGGSVFGVNVPTFVLPAFAGGDQPTTPPVPQGMLENVVGIDRAGATRGTSSPPGAYIGAATTAGGCRYVPLVVRM